MVAVHRLRLRPRFEKHPLLNLVQTNHRLTQDASECEVIDLSDFFRREPRIVVAVEKPVSLLQLFERFSDEASQRFTNLRSVMVELEKHAHKQVHVLQTEKRLEITDKLPREICFGMKCGLTLRLCLQCFLIADRTFSEDGAAAD